MNEDRQSLVHLHSNEIINGDGKIPTSGSVEYGEIAIGYADGYERMYIRNDSDEIVSFSSDDKFNESFRVMSKAMCDLDDRVLALEEMSALTVGDLIETTTELENVSSSGKTVDAIIIKGINNRLTGAETSAGTLNSAVNTLEASATSANTRITTLESSATSVNTRLDNLDSSATSANTRITTLESSASSVNNRLDTLESSATSANTRIATLESSATSVNTRLDNLDSSATSANTRIATLESSATSVNTRLDGLETSAGTFNTKISDLEASAITVNDVIYDENTFKNVSTSGKVVDAMVIKDAINEISPMVETTWSDLKALRDSSGLTTGMQYRITDYNTTTAQEYTQAAGHQFDIIVVADYVNKLNENARAVLHSGDTYFSGAGAKLEAWELKYCLDNDTTRFEWAVTGSTGRGVIYWMKDEWNNECPYDFKNIQFKRWKANWIGEGTSSLVGTYCLSFKYNGEEGYNGIMFDIEDINDFQWYYTFHCIDSSSGEELDVDASLITNNSGDCICHSNVIKEAHGDYFNDYFYAKAYLNDIVFCNIYGGDGENVCVNNFIDFGCFNMNFGNLCYGNKINFYSNCNIFGNECYYNTFGDTCYYNTFGNNCYGNTFGNDCHHNTFGNECQFNTFGNNCYYNTFGDTCHGNTFRNTCYYNTFGYNCYGNTFGNECYYNTFGNDCSDNTFGNNCQNIRVQKDYVYYIIVENCNQFIDITSTQTTSSVNILRNFAIAQGVNNTSTVKTISHNTLNDTFQTIYANDASGNTVAVNIADIAGVATLLSQI